MTAVAVRKAETNPIAKVLGGRVQDLAASAYKGFTPELVVEAALHASVHDPKILKCSPDSIFIALGKVARWGLHIGDEVHLVPFGNTLNAIPDYKGLMALSYRQGICRLIQPHPVYEHDHFEFEYGVPGRVVHQPASPEERGKLVGAWCHITLPGGIPAWHHMYLADIEAIRKDSKQWHPGKVKECPAWYAMKTVVRAWLNRQPKGGAAAGSALAEAMAADDAEFEVITAEAQPSAPMTSGPNVALPGTNENFGGYGGTPVVDAPKEVLERFTEWCHGDGKRAEKYADALAVAEERLVELVAAERDEEGLPE